MRILWFTNTSSNYETGSGNRFGSWISAMEAQIANDSLLEVAISFFHSTDSEPVRRGSVTYYPIKKRRLNVFQKAIFNFRSHIVDLEYLEDFKNVIDHFKPDIVHVFGTEGSFLRIQQSVRCPIIVQIQGLLNPIVNNYFPNGINKSSIFLSFQNTLKTCKGTGPIFDYFRISKAAKRELHYLKNMQLVIGRTDWDHSIVKYLNPTLTYFKLNEVLRNEFYIARPWKSHQRNKIIFVSTISPVMYKGLDLVYKTCSALCQLSRLDFEWRIIGIDSKSSLCKLFSKFLTHQARNKILYFKELSATAIVDQLLDSDIFIHPSHIDNSPNSVCEAQILGVPIIATNVGGIPSLIKNKETGLLVRPNAPLELAIAINDLCEQPLLSARLSERGRAEALERHDRKTIVDALKSVYQSVI